MLKTKCEEIKKIYEDFTEKEGKMEEARSELEKQIISLLKEAGFSDCKINSGSIKELNRLLIIINLGGEPILL